jgi:formyltetrahydrofolate synthetase
LIRIGDGIVIVVHSVCGIGLKEEAALSLTQTIHVLVTHVRQIEIHNAQILVIEEEQAILAGCDVVLLEADIVRQFDRKTVVRIELLIQDTVHCDIEISLSKSVIEDSLIGSVCVLHLDRQFVVSLDGDVE